MNMIGHPKHVIKALDVGVDIICAQAGEGGGHTGELSASILIPAVVDLVKGRISPLTGKPIYVIGAGAVFDGRGLAANLSWGAQGVCKFSHILSKFHSVNFYNHKKGSVHVSSLPLKLVRQKCIKNFLSVRGLMMWLERSSSLVDPCV